MVLSGVTSLDEVSTYAKSELKVEQELVPDFYVDKLADLVPYLN